MFIEAVCRICSCFRLPPCGKFTVGAHYPFEYLIDAEKVTDDAGEMIIFPENIFKACFYNLDTAITSYSPMLMDGTTYRVYLIIRGRNPDLEEIKAYAEIMQVNYLQAKKALIYRRNLISSQDACHTGEVLKKLSRFQVHYEIEPAYPY